MKHTTIIKLVPILLALSIISCDKTTEKAMEENPPENPLYAIQANAKLVPKMMKERLDVDLAYDSESVKWLDGYIERNREKLDAETINKLIDIFGSYLGEALIQTYGGKWEEYDNAWCVCFDENNKAFPFSKVAKQFENGSEDSIHSFFTILPMVMKLKNSDNAEQQNALDQK